MSIKFATFTMHDGKTLVKINPLRVRYLSTMEEGFTKVHFGPDQVVDVVGGLDEVANALTDL